MKIYWGLNSIPELAGLPKDEQQLLGYDSTRALFRRPRAWAGLALLAIMLVAGAHLPLTMLWNGLTVFIYYQIMTHMARPLIAARRAALEPQPRHDDGSYHVPPAF